MPLKCLTRKSKRASKIRTLLARDGNLCWLCGEPFSNKSGRKPSLDHVIPKSKGGPDRNENLKLAHSRCNNIRSDAMADEALKAFFLAKLHKKPIVSAGQKLSGESI